MDCPSRLVGVALRCYPARWRRRHGREAADLAALLIRDGTPQLSIACSYLVGAAREWLTPRSGRGLSTVAYALLVVMCLLSFSAALLVRTAPARAASTSPANAHTHCGTGSRETVHGATSPTRRPQAPSGEAGRGRSC